MGQLPGKIKWLKPVFAQRRADQPEFFALEKLTEIQELLGHRNISSVQGQVRGGAPCFWNSGNVEVYVDNEPAC